MNEIDYVYLCPECGTQYCGSMDCDSPELNTKVVCEECNYKMDLKVTIEVFTATK